MDEKIKYMIWSIVTLFGVALFVSSGIYLLSFGAGYLTYLNLLSIILMFFGFKGVMKE